MTQPKLSKGQQTRELLLEAALHHFTMHGFHGASMRQIAQEANLAVGGIYNHFANKDELFEAVILKFHPLNFIITELSNARGLTIEMRLRDVVPRFYTAMQAKPEVFKLLFIELVECQGRHVPELINALFPKIAAFAHNLRTVEGSLRPIPPLVVMRILVSTLLGYYLSEMLLSSNPLTTRLGTIDDYLEVLMHGILQKESKQNRQEQ
jgi:AcrR family transcriptional regulator